MIRLLRANYYYYYTIVGVVTVKYLRASSKVAFRKPSKNYDQNETLRNPSTPNDIKQRTLKGGGKVMVATIERSSK